MRFIGMKVPQSEIRQRIAAVDPSGDGLIDMLVRGVCVCVSVCACWFFPLRVFFIYFVRVRVHQCLCTLFHN